MAKLSLLDAFGLDASGSLRPDSHFPQLFAPFVNFKTTPLDKVQLASGHAELTFKQPIGLAAPGLALSIGAGAGGQIRILRPDDHILDRDDPFNSISIAPGEMYVELELTLSATAGVTLNADSVAFGISTKRELTVTIYRRFFGSDNDAFPSFGAALAQTFQAFVIPQSWADLQSLDRDTVVVVGGTGQLKLSGGFGIETPVRQLAATSPIAGNILELNAAASFNAECSITLEGGYQSRVRQLENQSIEIGIYKFRSRALAVQVSAEAGITANAGKFDLAEKFIGALSRQPVVDLQEFRQALPGEDVAARDLQIAAFQRNLAAAISTSVTASITAGVSALQSDESALTFEVGSESANSSSAFTALPAALMGDFTALTKSGSSLPPGIRQTSNIFTRTDLVKHKLSINVLGILNFISAGKLARVSTVERNANGEVTLVSDTADANRLQALLLNAAGNARRLRSMLSEDFLFQATFKVVDLQILPPEFRAKHTFFEINERTGKQKMKDLLDVCQAMDLITGEQETSRLQKGQDFGRTTFWLQATYSGESVERTFLTLAGSARSQEEFELQGRVALGRLLAGDEGQEFRKLISDLGPRGTGIWKSMGEVGNVSLFNPLFGLPLDAKDPRVAAAASDFLCITAWASAMRRLSEVIVEMRTLLNGSLRADDQHLATAREHLRECMADVVKHSGEQFGDPLGLVMVYLASQQSAGVSVLANGVFIQTLSATLPARVRSAEAVGQR